MFITNQITQQKLNQWESILNALQGNLESPTERDTNEISNTQQSKERHTETFSNMC